MSADHAVTARRAGDAGQGQCAQRDARTDLPQILAPAPFVAGPTDVIPPREAIEDTARGIADCRIIWHEGEGHVRTISGRRTAEEVMSFLRGT